ncbi:hypothetical protein HPP92_016547, partial [Vanilla planifolia]
MEILWMTCEYSGCSTVTSFGEAGKPWAGKCPSVTTLSRPGERTVAVDSGGPVGRLDRRGGQQKEIAIS